MKALLPIVFVILGLTAAVTYSLAKKANSIRQESTFGISANQLETVAVPKFKFDTTSTPTPSVTYKVSPTTTPKVSVTPTATPTPFTLTPSGTATPTAAPVANGVASASTKKTVKTTKVNVCTPVYGMANTCTEHVVVDTGAADGILFDLAGISYLAGLAAFIKAKLS